MRRIFFLPIVLLSWYGLRVPKRPASPAYPARDPVRQSSENRPADFSRRQFTLVPRAHAKNVLQIWVRSLSERDNRQITDEPKRGIRHYTWAYDSKHLIFAREIDGDENWQINVIQIDSKAVRNLTPCERRALAARRHVAATSARSIDCDESEKPALLRRLSHQSQHRRHPHGQSQRRRTSLVARRRSVERAHHAAAFAGTIVRERQGQPWRVARKWHPAEYGRYFGLSPDGKTFFMSGSYIGEVGALIALDLATGSETGHRERHQIYVQDAFIHPMTRDVQAVGFYKDRLEWQVLDQSVAGDFETLAALREASHGSPSALRVADCLLQ